MRERSFIPVHLSNLPVTVVGAGPIGLAAAANLVERGHTPLVLEAGPRVAASMWDWGHVRLFSPWSHLIDPASKRLLESHDDRWQPFDDEYVPLGKELVANYLDPLAALDAMAPHIRLNHKVIAVTRDGHDRMKDGKRDTAPFLIVADTPQGPRRFMARAVIDASGTWTTPNPLGAGGVWADGERANQEHIRYGMPDILGRERARYAGKRILVVGSGHSAIGSVLGAVELAQQDNGTQVSWAVRRTDPAHLWGGGASDELARRGQLGVMVHDAVHSGAVTLLTGLAIGALRPTPEGVEVIAVDGTPQVVVDEIVVATGSRPDLGMLRELRLELDGATESTRALGPMIDPNHHSCGTVRPHGATELRHPEVNFYTVGMKSYGRAPTFLLRTGYEQVRSVVAELDGDTQAADTVALVLPPTGACSTQSNSDDNGRGVVAIGCC